MNTTNFSNYTGSSVLLRIQDAAPQTSAPATQPTLKAIGEGSFAGLAIFAMIFLTTMGILVFLAAQDMFRKFRSPRGEKVLAKVDGGGTENINLTKMGYMKVRRQEESGSPPRLSLERMCSSQPQQAEQDA